MKRVIKFRIWSKLLCEWLTNHEILDYNPRAVTINHIFNHIDLNEDDIIYQQYSGIYDINVKEIYEGDIIQRDLVIDQVYVCEYSEEECAYVLRYYDDIIYLSDFKNIKIVGNIFENPELLKYSMDD